MRNTKCFRLVKKWRVSFKRVRAARDKSARDKNAAARRSGRGPEAAVSDACLRGAKPAGPGCFAGSRGRSVSYELLDNARVFSELSHGVLRLIDQVENLSSRLVSPSGMDHQGTLRVSTLANQVLKNTRHGSATCKQISAVITDSVDRIGQGLIVMEQAGFQMLQIIDAVIQGAEVTAFTSSARPAPSPHVCTTQTGAHDSDSEFLQQEVTVAVQDLKSWSLVLKRNLQVLQLSGHDDDFDAAWLAGEAPQLRGSAPN